MAYKLIITEKAEEQLDNLVYYLMYKLKNNQASIHLLDSIDKIYDRLEENPFQFPKSRDVYLQRGGYREAVLTDMDYVIVFRIEETSVYVTGIFHQLENYTKKA
ncbi:type II toxin-antitoxin system RelE/ParE family toxin [Mediterraneibacter glycyrrhizinilyticus]|nr:type II toxin-antitoxin system RelE/ParE family toxin [Mediterraneibacter glycyrrhizinilyticus]MBM6803457.1 type II toxin-antitoxin system RelE/ParE family toxin [Mediterraneibacter glycyrrhizinilyticus]HJA57775.1 type II toxin-antitoxin system RelE/ParE family toxin [Candidatus Bacteroides intestinigallinarum]